ncbi:hypothetical protein [Methylobacterium sp. J-077]|uniref:hypothetical protein n=1 Tax=Methylobacterium sp. J-077 TaxID=2836656 RepID=UPI001FBA1364|nr:hypothetical protein [Methylobacterium sp. J-077]MCJ2121793.1 hypothetical protein [Methylobacterium sp. J-077]
MALPTSLLFFAATGAVVLAQLPVIPGAFLMMFAAPYWSVVLVNFGFLGLAVEAATGRVTRLWLIAPIAWFGGYATWAYADHATLSRLRAEIATANDAVRVPFDPARQALVFEDDAAVRWFVERFALPVAYGRDRRYVGSSHRATRLAEREICDQFGHDTAKRDAGTDVFYSFSGRTKSPYCTVALPEDPTLPAVTVRRREEQRVVDRMPVSETTTTITLPDGRSSVLRGGTAAPLGWIPMPVMGCTLNSAGPRWVCFAQFERDDFTSLQERVPGQTANSSVLMRALGLAYAAPDDQRPSNPDDLRAAIAAATRRVTELETAKLDQVLADPAAQVGSLPFESLRGRVDLFLPRLGAMIAAVERGAGAQTNARANAERLFRLVEQVLADRLVPYRARIDALTAQDYRLVFKADSADR